MKEEPAKIKPASAMGQTSLKTTAMKTFDHSGPMELKVEEVSLQKEAVEAYDPELVGMSRERAELRD